MDKQLYTVKDIAGQIGTSERSVREAMKRGELPGKKICGKWVTSAEALNGFWQRGSVLKEGTYDRAAN